MPHDVDSIHCVPCVVLDDIIGKRCVVNAAEQIVEIRRRLGWSSSIGSVAVDDHSVSQYGVDRRKSPESVVFVGDFRQDGRK